MVEEPIKTGGNRDEKGRFLEGSCPNPSGRPKESFSLIGLLKKELKQIPEGSDKTNAELLVKKILKSAIERGSDAQIRNILQYCEGMPKEHIQQEILYPIPIVSTGVDGCVSIDMDVVKDDEGNYFTTRPMPIMGGLSRKTDLEESKPVVATPEVAVAEPEPKVEPQIPPTQSTPPRPSVKDIIDLATRVAEPEYEGEN